MIFRRRGSDSFEPADDSFPLTEIHHDVLLADEAMARAILDDPGYAYAVEDLAELGFVSVAYRRGTPRRYDLTEDGERYVASLALETDEV